MGSIEGSFIGLARYVRENWRDLTWFPLWHLGMPYANSYPPLLHWGVAAFAMISGFSIAHAFHWVMALTYCLGPVALFALALRLTKSPWTAFAAAALYSSISWSAWAIPPIAVDLGSPWHPRRLQALVGYGETPHIASMTLLPLALLFWDLALERRRVPYVLLAALGLAATVLTSWLGGFALAMMIVALAFLRLPKWRDVGLMSAIAVAAYCLAMPWTPPSTIAITQFNSQTIGGDFRETYRTMPLWFLGSLACLTLLKLATRRLDRGLQFSVFITFLFASVVFPWTWFNVAMVVQPVRYHLELEMALSLLAACTAQALLNTRPRWAAVVVVLMCVALVQPVRVSRRYARDVLIQSSDITKTSEWKTAQWLNREWTGERVMMPGSTSFWLAAFSDVPQFHGGPEQGTVNFMVRVAFFGVYRGVPWADGHNGEYSILWMKALGIQAVGVTLPESTETYKPFLDPHQFDGLLQPMYRDGGDIIYRVGTPRTSLARVVPRNALPTGTPKNGVDVDPLRPYVAALDDPRMPHADFRWNNMHAAHIAASVQSDQVISVQTSWHKGWRATANGGPLAVKRDSIGQIYLDPGRAGHVDIDLIFDGGTEMRISHALSAIAALVLVATSIVSLRRRS